MAEFRKRPGAAETLKNATTSPDEGDDGEVAPKTPEREFTVEARSQFQTIRRRFFRHKLAMISLAILTFIVLLAFLGPRMWPYDYSETNTADASTADGKGGPSLSAPPRCDGGQSSTVDRNGIEHSCAPHIFGTDNLGVDMFAQVMRGTQKSLQIAFMVAFLSTFFGVIIGAIAGFYRGAVDSVLMRIVDLVLTVPAIAIAACLSVKVQGGDWWLLGLILAGVGWTTIARIIRGEFLSLREKEFVEAAKALGASDRRIMFKHMLPNVVGSIIVNATLVIAAAILIETALSFLGLGVKAPDTSLGLIVSTYQAAFSTRPFLFWFPGLFIIVIALAVNFVGDGLRDAFDPKQTRVRAVTFSKGEEGEPILEVEGLTVDFSTEDGTVHAVRGVTYQLMAGEVLGIVGESGSGKSVSTLALMGLLPKTAKVTGSVKYRGTELVGMHPKQLNQFRGKSIAMIFQDPMTSMNPVHKVGAQIAEAVLVHHEVSRKEAWERAIHMLDLVGIPNAKERASQYPHEFSGGMRQRAMIAMAMSNDPDIIIADEPTTALDVTIQAQVLETLERVKDEFDSAVILITHDLGVIASMADRVMVMYAGKCVERATVDQIYEDPRMPYTLGLLGSLPRLDADGSDRLVPIKGSPPSLINLPPGCPFQPRCPLAAPLCNDVEPDLMATEDSNHLAACHYSSKLAGDVAAEDIFEVTAEDAELVPLEESS